MIERLVGAITPDSASGEAPEIPRYETSRAPGSTAEVDFWTSREVREVVHSHLNYMVADTQQWEQSAAYVIDTHELVEAFVKNAGLGFAIPYLHNGKPHENPRPPRGALHCTAMVVVIPSWFDELLPAV
jgi:type III restriction enzyme